MTSFQIKYTSKGKYCFSFNLGTYNPQYFSNQKTNIWEHRLAFPPPLQRAFDVFCIHLKFVKYHQLSIDKLLCKLANACHHLKNIQIIAFIKFINKRTFSLRQWMQMVITFQKDRKQRFPIMLCSDGHLNSRPIKENLILNF